MRLRTREKLLFRRHIVELYTRLDGNRINADGRNCVGRENSRQEILAVTQMRAGSLEYILQAFVPL